MGSLGRVGLRRLLPRAVFGALFGVLAGTACYDTGDGTAPPLDQFYFPVGLQVSNGGTVLYAVNSDFDLQYNGGTLQSYDLRLIRQHAVLAIDDPENPALPLVHPGSGAGCPDAPPTHVPGERGRQPLGETCAPPVDARHYFRDSAVIGAFATELLLSRPPSALASREPKLHADDPPPPAGSSRVDRLFTPVRGNATLTWASVERDDFERAPSPSDTKETYPPFRIRCGQDESHRCDHLHQIGEDPSEPGNTRHLTLPGEPFAAAISEDGAWLVMTHQSEPMTTLFSTGLSRSSEESPDEGPPPAIQFVTDQVPFGGAGIAAIPHDPDAFLGEPSLPRPAFLETSRAAAEVTLLRQYSDEHGGVGASMPRPFLEVEAEFPITASADGTDSRDIVIDPTPRLACKARVPAVGEPGGPATVEERDRMIKACARKPARAFIANRSPASLLIGEVGSAPGVDGAYDPDRLTIHSSVPLAAGPSKVYLAPIVDRDGAYALRVFAVCFDAATIFVIDPETGVLDNVIRVGPGPFAMAFDPFSLEDVAAHATVPTDPRDPSIRRYRFAYVASFTQSFVQVIDLDNAVPDPVTYQRIVYTLGQPTNPKGS